MSAVIQGGMYVVELMDKFSTSFPLLLVVLLEMVVIMWIYGNTLSASFSSVAAVLHCSRSAC